MVGILWFARDDCVDRRGVAIGFVGVAHTLSSSLARQSIIYYIIRRRPENPLVSNQPRSAFPALAVVL